MIDLLNIDVNLECVHMTSLSVQITLITDLTKTQNQRLLLWYNLFFRFVEPMFLLTRSALATLSCAP